MRYTHTHLETPRRETMKWDEMRIHVSSCWVFGFAQLPYWDYCRYTRLIRPCIPLQGIASLHWVCQGVPNAPARWYTNSKRTKPMCCTPEDAQMCRIGTYMQHGLLRASYLEHVVPTELITRTFSLIQGSAHTLTHKTLKSTDWGRNMLVARDRTIIKLTRSSRQSWALTFRILY